MEKNEEASASAEVEIENNEEASTSAEVEIEEVEKPYFCDHSGCRKSFATRSGRRKHQKKCNLPVSVSQKKEKYIKVGSKFQCTECNVCVGHINNFYRHYKNQHTEKKKKKQSRGFPCSRCDKVLQSSAKLAKHEKTHLKRKLECETCSKTFLREKNFQKHKLVCEKLLQVKFPLYAPLSEYSESFGYGDCEHLLAQENPQMLGDQDEGDSFSEEHSYPLDNQNQMEPMTIVDDDISFTIVFGKAGESIENQEQVVPGEEDGVIESADESGNDDCDDGETQRKTRYREKVELVKTLTRIKEKLPEEEQTKVLQASLNETGMSVVEEENKEQEFGDSVLEFLKELDLRLKENSDFFCTILHQCYGDQLLSLKS